MIVAPDSGPSPPPSPPPFPSPPQAARVSSAAAPPAIAAVVRFRIMASSPCVGWSTGKVLPKGLSLVAERESQPPRVQHVLHDSGQIVDQERQDRRQGRPDQLDGEPVGGEARGDEVTQTA